MYPVLKCLTKRRPIASLVRLMYVAALVVSCALGAHVDLYNPDPHHIWNRVHGILHVRVSGNQQVYGVDELDPLLWPETKYLLTGESHRQALAVLDEFLAKHAERMITDPLRRAIFQHDLWAVFYWSDNPNLREGTSGERQALQLRLARVMQRVSLSRAEIEKLPDNLADAAKAGVYASEKMPADLFSLNGPWICVFPAGGGPPAPAHSGSFGQSSFLVFLRLPGGRESTRAYLKRLNGYHDPWILKRYLAGGPLLVLDNPALPQFPTGTRVVLLRQAMLLDKKGDIVPTHLTESVQSRVYKAIPSDASARGEQENSEFRFSRKMLFEARAVGLRPVGANERKFSVFMTEGADRFEGLGSHEPIARELPILDSCRVCHEGSGIHSVRTYLQSFGTIQAGPIPSPGLFETDPAEFIHETIDWSQRRRHDLGLLQGFWLR